MGENDEDRTELIRTLSPHEFPSSPISLQFYWRANYGADVEQQIRQKVLDAVSEVAVQNKPKVAVVGRPGLSPQNDFVNVDLFDESGRRICALSIEKHGTGATRVLTHEPP